MSAKLITFITILLTKITAAQNKVALRHHKVHGLYFLAVIFAATIYILSFLNACGNVTRSVPYHIPWF